MSQALLLPKRLRPGDTVGLVSPSEPVFFPDRLERGITELEHLGLVVKLGEHAKERYMYCAGTDAQRAEDINAMFADAIVDGIITITGGSSANRVRTDVSVSHSSRKSGGYSLTTHRSPAA